jgi:hypothetical protein
MEWAGDLFEAAALSQYLQSIGFSVNLDFDLHISLHFDKSIIRVL